METKGHVLLMEFLDCIHALEDAEASLRDADKWVALGHTTDELDAEYAAANSARTDKMIEIENLLNKALAG